MPFPLLRDFGKVIPVRLRRPTKNGVTQCNLNSTAANHASDCSIPASITSSALSFASSVHTSNSLLVHPVSASREPGLEVPANVSSATYSWGVSPARDASDMAQLALPLIQAVAGAIPLVGAPVQSAIGGLLTSLQAIDRRGQNTADLNSLTLRLDRLSRDLCNAAPARDPLEQTRRDSLVRMLQDTSAKVTVLNKCCLAYTSITQAIAGCFVEIDRYLAEYLLSSQMQNQHDMHEVLASLQRQQKDYQRLHEDHQKLLMTMQSLVIRERSSIEPSAMHLTETVAPGCVTLVDATGHEHAISANFFTSFQQLNKMLQVLFERDSIEAQIQRRYMEAGHYYLCVDKGTEAIQLTSHGWPKIDAGTKIIMRVVIRERTTSFGVDYQCSFCGAENHIGEVGSIMRSLQQQSNSVCSIDCRVCKRRFQISRLSRDVLQSTRSCNIDTNHTATGAEMRLIRNFHVEQNLWPPQCCHCGWRGCHSPRCPFR